MAKIYTLKIRYKLLVVLLLFSLNLIGQENEKVFIMKTISTVFEAMKTNDSTLLKSSFTQNPNTFTLYTDQNGKTNLTKGNFKRFVSAVGQPKEHVWNEPIWNEKVEIDGNLASVWVDYAFYIDEQFSHCGVDAFHLIKVEGSWKIFHLVDTRRKNNCNIPENIKP